MRKCEFIESELISASIRGAFQRANVYADGVAEDDPARAELRDSLAGLLRRIATQYVNPVCSERHELNIQKIADDLTAKFGDKNLLRNNRFRIGVAQKALNLYLKYLWCLDKIPTPPHCPFDNGIVTALNLNLNWTELDSIDGYRTIVDAAMQNIQQTGHGSLSDWELEEWTPD